jgi:hypothetical protein
MSIVPDIVGWIRCRFRGKTSAQSSWRQNRRDPREPRLDQTGAADSPGAFIGGKYSKSQISNAKEY